MSESLSRAFVSDIEIRSGGDGRTVHGIFVPFGQVARVSDGGRPYEEAFQRGSLAKTIMERGGKVKLLSHHNSRTNPLGRATLLREDAAGGYGEFHVSATRAGDEALELVRDGAMDSFSIGFAPVKHVQRDGVTWRTEVALREVSLVTLPAYAGAMVGGVRDIADALTDAGLTPEEIVARLMNLPPASPIGDPEAGTATAAATVEQDPASPVPSAHQIKLAFARAIRERGVA